MDLLNGEPVIVLSGDEFLPKEGKTFAQQVNEYFQSQGGKANSLFGEVLLDLKGIQNSKQHGMSRIKAAAFAAIKDVLENGVEILPMGQHRIHDKIQPTGMIAAPIQIGDEKYVCVVEVIANLQVQRLYVHEAFVTKNLQEIAASNLVHGSDTTSPQPQGEIAKVLQNYVMNNKNKENNQTIGMNTIVDNNGTTRSATKWTHGADNVVDENKTNKNIKMNKKQVIKLSESDLHRIVKESVNKTLNDEFLNNIVIVDIAAKKAASHITDSYFSFRGLDNVRNNNVDFSEETVKLRRRWLNLYHPLYSAIVDAVKNVLDSNDF